MGQVETHPKVSAYKSSKKKIINKKYAGFENINVMKKCMVGSIKLVINNRIYNFP